MADVQSGQKIPGRIKKKGSGNVSLEAFLLKSRSAEGFPIIVGGLADTSESEFARACYQDLSSLSFCGFKDQYLIDSILCAFLAEISPVCVRVLGASVSIPGVQSGGGILGDPFSNALSATGKTRTLPCGGYIFASPGGPGLAVLCGKKQFHPFETILSREDLSVEQKIDRVKDSLKTKNYCYVLAADGCGEYGSAYVSAGDGENRFEL